MNKEEIIKYRQSLIRQGLKIAQVNGYKIVDRAKSHVPAFRSSSEMVPNLNQRVISRIYTVTPPPDPKRSNRVKFRTLISDIIK